MAVATGADGAGAERLRREWRRFGSNDPRCFASSLVAITRFDALGRLPELRVPTLGVPTLGVPTLVVRGRYDELVSAEEAADLASAIPGARLVTVEGAGHVANRDQPEAFDRELRTFLRDAARCRVG